MTAHAIWPPVEVDWWSCPPLWRGKTCFIVACGPSLRGFDFERLRGRHVIAIKEMWRFVPFAEFMFFADYAWLPSLDVRPLTFAGEVVTTAFQAPPHKARIMRAGATDGITATRDTLCGARTSVHFALNLAAHLLDFGRIGLLGVDLGLAPDGATHCHEGHPLKIENFGKQVRDLTSTVAPLRDRGIEVFNCTPGGFLDLWPRRDLEDVL